MSESLELALIAGHLNKLVTILGEIRDTENQALDFIRGDQPSGFTVQVSTFESKGELQMGTATVDLQILDDGKGVKYVFTPVKADGVTPTTLPAGVVPSFSSSNPAMDVAPDLADPTGLTCNGTIHQPAADAAGIVVSISATLPNGKVITKDAPSVDIVPDPNNPNNPGGFTVAETAA